MKQKSSFFKALGIMLLSVLFATQANAQNLTVSQTLTETTPFPMFRQTQLSYSPISDIRHKRLP